MKGMAASRLAGALAIAGVLSLTACKDNGLREGTNQPLDQARNRESPYPVYEPAAESTPVSAGGRAYVGSAPNERIPASLLEPVGASEGVTLYAVRGSEAPYARLYAETGTADTWRPYLRLN